MTVGLQRFIAVQLHRRIGVRGAPYRRSCANFGDRHQAVRVQILGCCSNEKGSEAVAICTAIILKQQNTN